MARIHDGLIRQCKELLPDAGEQRLRIASWQIGAPDGSSEERIAGKHHTIADERHAASAVPRQMSYGK
jgi:hypothetical protein